MTDSTTVKKKLAPRGNRLGALKYKPEYDEMARRFCLLKQDATDLDLATFFQVTGQTILNWKKDFPSFKQAVWEGKEQADSNVANALHQRAIGYSHPAIKIMSDPESKKIVKVDYIEHYPPDTQAAKLWLTNRSRHWKDKQTVEIEDPDDLLARVLGVDKDKLPE